MLSFFMLSHSRTSTKEKKGLYSLNTEDPFCYNMGHKRRGHCIIFNHQYFDCPSLNERKGTEVDCIRIKGTFQNLGFEVDVYKDLTSHEVRAILKAGR